MTSPGLRILLCSIVLTCTACIVVPTPAPAPRVVASVAPAAPRPGYCREFQQTVTIGGVAQQAYGVSCQQADGSWRISGDQTTISAPVGPVASRAVAAPAPPDDGSYLLIPFARASGDDGGKPEK
jgi:hypothetical protein